MDDTDLLQDSVTHALETLRAGGLILYPTDTVWGIGCDATDEKAVARIYDLKQRPDSKSLIILVADERQLLKHVASPDPAVSQLLRQSTRPTTVIYEGALGLAPNAAGVDGSIAIRIVREVFCRTLVRRLGKPLVSTSANISGRPTPQRFADIEATVTRGVDYVVPYRQDNDTPAIPSRIIKVGARGQITVIRE
jgi:L-threonylcarbamoyladenylate synthase